MSQNFIAHLWSAMFRPMRLALIFSSSACAAAVFWLVPQDQHPLAVLLTIALGAPLLITILHSLKLARWIGRLQQSLESHTLEWQSVVGSVARLEASTHAADLNVGSMEARISELEAKLEARISEPEEAPPLPRGISKKTFFLHIPKCGGTTVFSVLAAIYGQQNTLNVGHELNPFFSSLSIDQRRAYHAIGGHGTLIFYDRMLGGLSEYYKITTLRDPIDRLLSEFNYAYSTPDNPGHSYVRSVGFDAVALNYPCNLQVFTLTGTQTDVGRAVQIVRHFFDDWALLSELADFLPRIWTALGSPPANWVPQNPTNYVLGRADVSIETIQLLESRNAADFELLDRLGAIKTE